MFLVNKHLENYLNSKNNIQETLQKRKIAIFPCSLYQPIPTIKHLNVLDSTSSKPSARDLVRALLDEQQQISAVEHVAKKVSTLEPDKKLYTELIPTSLPAKEQQYAFEVSLDDCSGCKSCVSACHSLNGLEEKETWRSVGLLHGGKENRRIFQSVTTACHHCLEPACLKGCPVKAYDKDPVTGIVKHLDDQCIGCQYCVFMCPYEVPSYSESKGIVRKCDMCTGRLEKNEAPACVDACPNGAIRIKIVDNESIRLRSETQSLLPGSPDSRITNPTTHYKREKAFPNDAVAADYFTTRREKAHPPLVIMLVLTQLVVGAFVTTQFLLHLSPLPSFKGFEKIYATTLILLSVFALGSSVLHLGRPVFAFRAFLGFRHSWLSREIIFFGLFAKLAGVYALSLWFEWNIPQLGIVCAAVGVLGVYASIMVYVATKRPCWRPAITAAKFLITSALLGVAATTTVLVVLNQWNSSHHSAQVLNSSVVPDLLLAVISLASLKLLVEALLIYSSKISEYSPLGRSSKLLLGELRNLTILRFFFGFLGGIVVPAIYLFVQSNPEVGDLFLGVFFSLGFLFLTIGEFAERHLFFLSSVAPRMPGQVQG